jgi:sugar lactone lactonase YvrE
MNVRMATLALVMFAAAATNAHPPVSVAVDRQGHAYYSDLSQVWQVSPDGTKTIVVPSVHTHELYLDAEGNLYGEHLWYEGERTDKWGHYVWRRSPDGRVEKIIPDREGFLRNYSFVRDAGGTMYWANREKGQLERKRVDGRIDVIARELKGMRWMTVTPSGTVYVIDGGDMVRVTPDRRVTRLARGVGKTSVFRPQASRHTVMGLWTDGRENVYAAVYGEGKVKRISPDGTLTEVAESPGTWAPTGGAFAPNGDLLLLECSATNQIRLRRLRPRTSPRTSRR